MRSNAAVDFHTHLAPRVDETDVGGVERADGCLIVDGLRVGPDALYRPEELSGHLARCGLDTAIVSLPPPLFRQHLPLAESERWVRSANDGLLSAVSGDSRLRPLAYLPLEHPGVAVAEYSRVRRDLRWAGVVGCAGAASVPLGEAALAPLWSSLDHDRRLLLLHPGASPDDRLTPFYLKNLLGNPVETAIAAAQLVFSGRIGEFPGMRVLLAHCGGVLPAVVGRWQQGVLTKRPGIPEGIDPPAVAVRRFWVDCLAHHPSAVGLAAQVFGDDHIVLGSDWPFPMGIDDPQLLVAHRGQDYVTRVARMNASALLGGSA